MAKQRIRRKPTHKQMAFETAVRNPERYIDILSAVSEFEGTILNDKNLLKIMIEFDIFFSEYFRLSKDYEDLVNEIQAV